MSERDPGTARAALAGLAAYQQAPRAAAPEICTTVAQTGSALLRDCGGGGPPAVLVPSLINPPHVLDLDPEVSLAAAVAGMGRRVLLLDWGPADARSALDVGRHVAELLVPLLGQLGEPAALVGYCLGGTMAIAAANLAPVERLATIAAPWRFDRYPPEARAALQRMWADATPAATRFGALPMEVLQAAFWSLDPERTVRKFAQFAAYDPAGPQAQRFIRLEDWANEGEPLPFAAARELIEDFFAAAAPGRGEWRIGARAITDRLPVPVLNATAAHDRIAPAATAPAGEVVALPTGHVGMVVGSARHALHQALAPFLDPLAARARQG